ncbi:SusD/RagB family nutrient-binding outer membrane lipoprotein [Chitinophaga filiformis]|uniref:Starch-binding associating with outer membrane n=1 Tax=Chitinophaga filiformis TaxID=104663 RepID=A0A1G7INQ0_CHIFI|nr:SusD/RagB family nutrient-binding outer membrane lipoprotein [Chitinophaga filiformis]SDF14370.1 Starch-binding associating with outer membrane [Chitinophaga filiformis]
MKKIINSATSIFAALSLIITGCGKFLDINDNPTKTADLDPGYLLPTSQANIAMVLGNHFQVYGGIWAQYWTQDISSSQYRNIEQVNLDPSGFDRPWQFLYIGALQNLQTIIDKAYIKRWDQYAGIAELLKAYSYQLLTDGFGDVPLRDAIRVGTSNILATTYDPQKMVYDSILAMIDRGLKRIDAVNTVRPGNDDLIFGGNMANWKAFGNTLKLRTYMRLAKIDSAFVAQGIATLAGATFLTSDAKISYINTNGNNNPLFAEVLGLGRTQNLIASSTAVDQMNALNDPRVFTFYRTTPDTFGIAGIPQGSYKTQWNYRFSAPGVAVGAYGQNDSSALAPVKFISAAESYFLQAEAVARGYLPGDARALYRQGITASFAAYNIVPGNYIIDAVAAFPATGTETQVKAIITQKYFAMCGNQNFEAWTEWRRTGYPSFLVRSQASILPAGQMPQRFLYPGSEITRNPKFPGAKRVYDKVWWDTN